MAMPLASVTTLSLIYICLGPSEASKLNVPRVLLPYNHDGPTNFTLKTYEGGCYRWSSSRDELVSLSEVGEDGCANEVQVSAISRSPTRQTAIILAQDLEGEGQVLRCDVLIDAIQRLEIVTTTRELYVEEAPEEFEVRAYDDQGNEFSTLEGVEMIWDLQTLSDRESVSPPVTVLRFITFTESPYECPPAIAPLESLGRQGNKVLVEGRQTGSAKLSVRLAHPAYQQVAGASVDLMVVANLLLEPADVTLLPHTTVTYTVYQLKQGHLTTIDLPSSQFYLQVADAEVAELGEDGISIYAKVLGTTQVILRDKNVDESSSWVKQPSASVRVVEPSYLQLKVVPPQGPALVTSRPVAVAASAYDAHHNRIFLTENVVMETMVPAEYFTPEMVTKNGSYVYGIPVKEGKTVAMSTLSAVEVGDGLLEITPALYATLDLAIYPPLRVLPPLTILPWDPVTMPTYSVNLTVEGGCGSVGWSSSKADVVSVTTGGTCHTKTQGAAVITAASTTDPHNKNSAQIYIVEAMGLSLLEREVETEVDEPLSLHLVSHTTTKDGRHLPFTTCHRLPFEVECTESSFVALPTVLASTVAESCAVLQVVGKSLSFSTINISYQTSEGKLEASTLVGAYRPLVAINPSSGETVLAVGSSRVVVFQGGPLPWPTHKPSMHKATVKVEESEVVEVKLVGVGSGRGSVDIHGVEVVCRREGQTTLTLTVANTRSSALPYPHKASASVSVVCGVPDSLTLVALTRRPPSTTSPCPTHDSLATIAHCYKPLNLELVVRDSENRRFDNVSSLGVTWSISELSLVTSPLQDQSSLTQVTSLHGFTVPIRTYQVMQPVGAMGEVTVTAALTVAPDSTDHPTLTDSILIKLVQDAVINPASAVLYRHQDNKLDLKVKGGSGHFELQTTQSGVASLTHHHKENSVNVIPLSDGEVKVVLVDLCLEADSPASSHITVASIASLDLIMVDRVELGGSLEAEVVALTTKGAAVPAHALMALTPHPQSPIITLRSGGINKGGNAVYEVMGQQVGDTTLRVSAAGAGSGAERVYSPSRPLQVFPPLRLRPHNITLVVGAVYQVETQGGPYPDAVIEFTLKDDEIATASHTGLVTATALGTTTLTAAALTHPKDSTRKIVYSQDSVTINVVPLEKVRIYAPLRQLETGTSMPLYALGQDSHQGPPAYASTVPPLAMDWSLSDKQAAHLVGLYSENGLHEGSENQGIVQLRALKPGRVTVTLKVQPTSPASISSQQQLANNTPLTDKLEIKIFESLKLRSPGEGSSRLLLTPHSEVKITTNRDGAGHLTYHVEGQCSSSSRGGGSKNEMSEVVEVGPDGVVRSGAALGQAVVVVTVEEGHGITQSLSVLVEVKKVRYLQLTVGTVIGVSAASRSRVSQVPIGTVLPVTVSRHDDRGRTFHASNTYPTFRPSRFDLVGLSVGVDNRSLVVEARGRGQTVLHIWDVDPATTATTDHLAPPSASAYLRIHSGSAISPDGVSVVLGSHICFSSPLVGVKGGAGKWSAGTSEEGEDSILSINPDSGVAFSHSPGRTTVAYRVGPAVTTTTDITILPITQIRVSSPVQPLTNCVEGDWQVARVVMEAEGSASSSDMTDSSVSCLPVDPTPSHMPFTCSLVLVNPPPELSLSDLFEATPVYIPKEGYGCRVRSVARPDTQLAMWSLGVEVVARAEGTEEVWDSAEVAFLPAPTLELTHVTLTLDQPAVEQVVTGLPEVLAALQVPSGGGVGGVEVSLGAVSSDNTRAVTVVGREAAWTGLDSPPSPLTLTIISPLTRGILQINVTVEKGSEVCPSREEPSLLSFVAALVKHYDRLIISLSCLVLIIACFVIGYHALLGSGYKQTRHTGVFANPPSPPLPLSPFSSGSTTPSNNSIPSSPSASPTSPSPHRPQLWSVGTEPVYGGAHFRRSAYHDSPTYSPPKK